MTQDPRAEPAHVPIGQALALGALHGPAELLPVSSSGHITALPWLLGWRYSKLGDEARKSFEVALHAGSATAWLLARRTYALRSPCPRDNSQLLLLGLAAAPAGVAGLVLERPIEHHLGTPGVIAVGLAVGAVAMAAADAAPEGREAQDAEPVDAAWLGMAQAAALLPGISRTGATLVAARLRGFESQSAWLLSSRVGTPVIGGAAALKLARTLAHRPSRAQAAGLLAGAGASFGSTLLAARVLRPLERGWPLRPFAAYRMALALALVVRLRSSPRASTDLPLRSARV
jgi:undecaprenyl-diphosphatase